ncbi:MAG: 16S rRNA (cytidine(1402)-2'-O)-methyltransferase [Rickettsiales bacterium]|nr:16S rRNA (cytidine(1402)-2'-O)-methyltransferase [Rickettsiales bacterium]
MQINKINLTPALYVIATPIGNLKDITIRALETLASLDVLFCEDVRVTGKLLKHYDLQVKLNTYNDFSKQETRDYILEQVRNGKAVGLVSDAGTPLISDPGYKLVRFLLENNIKIIPVTGASSVITSLSVSGLPSDSFYFAGFLPSTKEARRNKIEEFSNLKTTIILFERAERVFDLTQDFIEVLGDFNCCLAREITKLYEEFKLQKLSELNLFLQENKIKGECVLLIDTRENFAQEKQNNLENLDEFLINLMSKYKLSEASEIAANKTGIKKKKIYSRLLELRGVE